MEEHPDMEQMDYKLITKGDFDEKFLDTTLRICWQGLSCVNSLIICSDIVKRFLDFAFGQNSTVIFELKQNS